MSQSVAKKHLTQRWRFIFLHVACGYAQLRQSIL